MCGNREHDVAEESKRLTETEGTGEHVTLPTQISVFTHLEVVNFAHARKGYFTKTVTAILGIMDCNPSIVTGKI